MRFKAFISYKHVKSTRFAENLELAIKAYAKPIYRPPISVFRDEKYLRPGGDLPRLITNALKESEFLIYLASPEAAASKWVQDELAQWCQDAERCQRFIIVLTAGTIAADPETKRIDWKRTDALPALLASRLEFVPFYVDLTWAERDNQQTVLDPNYKKAINAIVAALRDVDPIVLSGQEVIQHRRNIRIRNSFVAAISLLAVLLGGVAWFAWDQKVKADARAREATSRRLAAEADRLAEARIDRALLLMAQAYRMGDNAALRSSWWRLLGMSNVPETYLQVRASDLYFRPDGGLTVAAASGPVHFARTGDGWTRASSAPKDDASRSPSAASWQWSGGSSNPYSDDAGPWQCAGEEARIIGPYGDTDDFCIRSRLQVPGWCAGAAIEFPGFKVDARRTGEWVHVTTDKGSASYFCSGTRAGDTPAAEAEVRPRLVAGDRVFFPQAPELAQLDKGGAAVRKLSQSFDQKWLAVLRSDDGVEIWPYPTPGSLRARPGVTVLEPHESVRAIAATTDGAIAFAVAPGAPGGDVRFWKDFRNALDGLPPDRRIPEAIHAGAGGHELLALSSDGSRVVTGGRVSLSVINTATGEKTVEDLHLGRNRATAAELTARAQRLAVVIRPLDGAINRPVWLFDVPRMSRNLAEDVHTVAFDPAAPDAVITAGGRGIQQWSVSTGKLTRTLLENAVVRIAIEPGQRRLAASLADKYLLVRSLEDPANAVTSGQRNSPANALAFLPGENTLLWASDSGLEAWNWPSDAWLTIDGAAHSDVRSLPDGMVLALTRNRAVIYDLRPARWLELTCRIVGRNLTSDEWRAHIGDAFAYESTCPAGT